jgi:hypothetical protein
LALTGALANARTATATSPANGRDGVTVNP